MRGPFLNGALEKFSNLRLGIYGVWGTLHMWLPSGQGPGKI